MNDNFTNVKPLCYWVQHVLPLVYDDSLSYMELLGRVTKRLNELIENNNKLPDYIMELIKEYISSGEIEKVLAEVLANYMLNVKFPPSGLTPATGDGSADDTEAIQGCIDYAYNNGGMSVYFPSGSYLTQPLTLRNKATLFGQDRYTTRLVMKGGATTAMFTGDVDELTLSGLGFDGNMDIQVNNVNLFTISVNSAIISNCLLTDGYDLLNITVNNDLQLNNLLFRHAVENALVLKGNGFVQGENLIFKSVSTLVGKNFVVMDVSKSILEQVKCYGASPNGILINGNNNVVKMWNEQSLTPFVDNGVNNSVTVYTESEVKKLSGSKSAIIGGNVTETITGNKGVSAHDITESATGNRTENTTGNRNETTGGNNIEQTEGNSTETVTGDKIVSSQNYNETVSSEKVTTANKSTETVTTEKDFNANVSRETLGTKTVNVNGVSTENSASKNETITGDKIVKAANSTENITANKTVNAVNISNIASGDITNTAVNTTNHNTQNLNEQIDGNRTVNIKGTDNETTGAKTTTIIRNKTETIHGSCTETIDNNMNISTGGELSINANSKTETINDDVQTTVNGSVYDIIVGENKIHSDSKIEVINTTSSLTINDETKNINNNSSETVENTKSITDKNLNITSSVETKIAGKRVDIATSDPMKYFTPTSSEIFDYIPMLDRNDNQYLVLVNDNSTNKIKSLINNGNIEYDLKLAQEYGIITSESPNIVTVSNVTELKNAIDSANPAVKNLIYINPGYYMLTTAYPPSNYEKGCILPNNTYLIGLGGQGDVTLDTTLDTANRSYSCINFSQNGGLFNLTLNCKNTRYAVHDDGRYNGICTRIIKNVMFNCYNMDLQWCYGAGINPGNNVIFDSCKFNGLGGNIYFHNMYGGKQAAYITIRNCNFKMRSGGYDEFEIVLEWADSYDNIAVENQVYVTIENCNVNQIGMKYNGGYSQQNKFNVSVDKPTLLHGIVDWERIIMPNIKRMIADTSQGSIVAGSVVTKHDYNKVWRFPDNWNLRFSYGIALTGIINDNNVIVAVDGYFYPFQLNVSGGSGGKYLINTNGVLSFGDTATNGAVGFQTADNELIELAMGTRVMYGGI